MTVDAMDTHCVRRERKVLIFSGCNSHPATGSLQPGFRGHHTQLSPGIR